MSAESKALYEKSLYESMVSSFKYNPPKDPELLLYDFYFMVGYVFGNSVDKPEEQWALDEALRDCVNNLQKHMINAIFWSLSAELRHITGYMRRMGEYILQENMPEKSLKFLRNYLKSLDSFKNDYVKKTDPERYNTPQGDYSGALRADAKGGLSNEGSRSYDYKTSYESVVKASKKLKLTAAQTAQALADCYNPDMVYWYGAFGGEKWMQIAKALYKLITAKNINEKIIYIDHAYDLQHNTGSVFTKLKSYYKNSTYDWLKNALDWKRDVRDLRDFYTRVSGSLRPIVAWVAYNTKGITIEDLQKDNDRLEKAKNDDRIKAEIDYKSQNLKVSSNILHNESFLDSIAKVDYKNWKTIPIFKVGSFYSLVSNSEYGRNNLPSGWVSEMAFILEGTEHKCIKINPEDPYEVEFEDQEVISNGYFHWWLAPFILAENSDNIAENPGTVSFVKNHYYKYIGPPLDEFSGEPGNIPPDYSGSKHMLLDGKPHLCTYSSNLFLTTKFEDIPITATYYGSQFYVVECTSDGRCLDNMFVTAIKNKTAKEDKSNTKTKNDPGYKVGDWVMVKPLDQLKKYGWYASEMGKYAGQKYRISEVLPNYVGTGKPGYYLAGVAENYFWTSDMIYPFVDSADEDTEGYDTSDSLDNSPDHWELVSDKKSVKPGTVLKTQFEYKGFLVLRNDSEGMEYKNLETGSIHHPDWSSLKNSSVQWYQPIKSSSKPQSEEETTDSGSKIGEYVTDTNSKVGDFFQYDPKIIEDNSVIWRITKVNVGSINCRNIRSNPTTISDAQNVNLLNTTTGEYRFIYADPSAVTVTRSSIMIGDLLDFGPTFTGYSGVVKVDFIEYNNNTFYGTSSKGGSSYNLGTKDKPNFIFHVKDAGAANQKEEYNWVPFDGDINKIQNGVKVCWSKKGNTTYGSIGTVSDKTEDSFKIKWKGDTGTPVLFRNSEITTDKLGYYWFINNPVDQEKNKYVTAENAKVGMKVKKNPDSDDYQNPYGTVGTIIRVKSNGSAGGVRVEWEDGSQPFYFYNTNNNIPKLIIDPKSNKVGEAPSRDNDKWKYLGTLRYINVNDEVEMGGATGIVVKKGNNSFNVQWGNDDESEFSYSQKDLDANNWYYRSNQTVDAQPAPKQNNTSAELQYTGKYEPVLGPQDFDVNDKVQYESKESIHPAYGIVVEIDLDNNRLFIQWSGNPVNYYSYITKEPNNFKVMKIMSQGTLFTDEADAKLGPDDNPLDFGYYPITDASLLKAGDPVLFNNPHTRFDVNATGVIEDSIPDEDNTINILWDGERDSFNLKYKTLEDTGYYYTKNNKNNKNTTKKSSWGLPKLTYENTAEGQYLTSEDPEFPKASSYHAVSSHVVKSFGHYSIGTVYTIHNAIDNTTKTGILVGDTYDMLCIYFYGDSEVSTIHKDKLLSSYIMEQVNLDHPLAVKITDFNQELKTGDIIYISAALWTTPHYFLNYIDDQLRMIDLKHGDVTPQIYSIKTMKESSIEVYKINYAAYDYISKEYAILFNGQYDAKGNKVSDTKPQKAKKEPRSTVKALPEPSTKDKVVEPAADTKPKRSTMDKPKAKDKDSDNPM
jgi:hypothetical protein